MIVFFENKNRITDRWWRYMQVQLLLCHITTMIGIDDQVVLSLSDTTEE